MPLGGFNDTDLPFPIPTTLYDTLRTHVNLCGELHPLIINRFLFILSEKAKNERNQSRVPLFRLTEDGNVHCRHQSM